MKRMIQQIAMGVPPRCIAFAIWGCICVGSDTKCVWPVIMQMHTILYMFMKSFTSDHQINEYSPVSSKVASMRVTT
jgi:hypothetical protein